MKKYCEIFSTREYKLCAYVRVCVSVEHQYLKYGKKHGWDVENRLNWATGPGIEGMTNIVKSNISVIIYFFIILYIKYYLYK